MTALATETEGEAYLYQQLAAFYTAMSPTIIIMTIIS